MKSTKWPVLFLTAMGLGRLWPAPGTWGSLPPVVLTLLMVSLSRSDVGTFPSHLILNTALLVLAAVFSYVCLAFGSIAEQHFRRKDPSSVVADEVAGQSIALLFLPWRSGLDSHALKWNLLLAATAFLAFRAMDIIKPPPARSLQRLSGGRGILIDDLIAGVYALIIAQLAARLLWPMLLA